MKSKISVWGVETNNLKNIDVELDIGAINLIVGPSGSGKSSLAYDTIAQIGQHEFMTMFADDFCEPTYKVKGYKNMIAAVPIKQSNYNSNMRSTIATYFGLSRKVSLIYAATLGLPENLFVLNKEENFCPDCRGLGFIRTLDPNKIVDYDVPLYKNPIRCWSRNKDFYVQILSLFCADNGIDTYKTFRELSPAEKETVLFGESEKKYVIHYRRANVKSQRTTKYYGVMSETPMLPKFSPSVQFYSEKTCPSCHGAKFSSDYEKYRINDLSIGEFMTMPFCRLIHHIRSMTAGSVGSDILFALDGVLRFVQKANELHLGHLSLNRAIPTLSGGELQRLRMVQVLNTQLTNLLLVLDEPLAGLSGKEKMTVYTNILGLSGKHTLLIVDHSDTFVSAAKHTIALGTGGGKNGGALIDAKQYLSLESVFHQIPVAQPKKSIRVQIRNKIYQYDGVDLGIGENCLNLITGPSGVGKSTLLREYMPQFFEHYSYISSKPLIGKANSTVATSVGVMDCILGMFAKKFRKDKDFFCNQSGCSGACKVCAGTGFVKYGNGYEAEVNLECSACRGTGFNHKLQGFKIFEKNIFDIMDMTIDEAQKFFEDQDHRIVKILQDASALMLGHLKIGQPISTLSGGENIRIRLLKSAKANVRILGIDEPFRGLSNTEIFHIAQYLDLMRRQGQTIIVADHTENIDHYFAKHIILKRKDNVLSE